MSKPRDPFDMPLDDQDWWQALDNDNAAQRHYQILLMQEALKQEIQNDDKVQGIFNNR